MTAGLDRENDPVVRGFLEIIRFLSIYHRYEARGLHHVPGEGAAIVAVSHSLATYDGFLLAAEIYRKLGRAPAGLADKRIFDTPGLAQLFARLGAVQGSPLAGERLLNEGHLLMLAPGGMRESLRSSRRKYQIDWAGRLGFARLAVKAQVPVVLAACPAADDVYTVYDNPLTPAVYRRFKWPLPFARGLGFTALPRPVKLIHYVHEPMYPPPLREGSVDETDVKTYHAALVREMNALMKQRQS